MDPTSLTHAELTDALRALRLGVDASDLHGSLSGYLCAGGEAGSDDWTEALQLGFDEPELARNRTLERLYRECRAQFAEQPASVDPLLPATAAGLPRRADALIEWCRGFLGGVGLSGATSRTDLSADAREILADLGMIAASSLQYADARDDERALDEVLVFVRAGAAMLHRELSQRARARALH
ncbi:UPF0149 family protein [Dokdonella ginsengisoli]|uniref:UPF0149 family protein n=1 Tax=Dokdonella ginsengisoli TaxID=363846 RepID=A0ABV9QVG6_9GAMM